MDVSIIEAPMDRLAELGRVSIAFSYDALLEVEEPADGALGLVLVQRSLSEPRYLDYDDVEGNTPADLPERFDLSSWGLLLAEHDGAVVGGAILAWNTEATHLLEGRDDVAVIWDLRVAPEARGNGVGTFLFEVATAWAMARGCRELKVETQNVNLAACRFYARRGCTLRSIDRGAYPEHEGEVQLIWSRTLGG